MSRTLFSEETTTRCVEALVARHGRHLQEERIAVNGRVEEGAVRVDLTLARMDQTANYRMETAFELPENESLSASEAGALCLDFLDWYLDQFFGDNRQTLLPLDWQAHTFGEHRIFARGDVTNPVLDEAADAWLRGELPEIQSPGKEN
jgi:hypothetical protein